MNERIKELEAKCWESRQYGPPWFNSQQFAELLVEECLIIVMQQKQRVEDMEVFNPVDVLWNRARAQHSQHIADKIKEYFGVE